MGRGGSYGAAIHAYMPVFAPPSVPIPENLVTGSNVYQNVPAVSTSPVSGSAVVNRRERQLGNRFLYARGAKRIRQFIMMATGAVQSSQFQPYTSWTWDGSFDDCLYQAGYPGTNLGISEKVPTIPVDAINAPWQMTARPRFRRSVVTTRSFGGAAGVAAKPVNYGRE
jgi:hypothetical protein